MKLQPGQMIADRYKVEGPLGQGGFATVYAGVDIASQRRVAIKVLDLAGDTNRARFDREIQAVAGLRDEHTVTMFSHGELDNGQPYVVFERVDGSDLADVLAQRGRLTPEITEHIVRQVLFSLREAHRQGVIHRDLKPENIRIFGYMGDPWRVKVLDFGLARRWDASRPQLTAAGEILGTPRYMAPEQLLEQDLGPTCDIYSLGLVAFEMLAGRGALQGQTWLDQLDRLTSGYLFAAPGIADAGHLHGVIARMTMRDPAKRFPSVDAVLAALDGVQAPRLAMPTAVEGPAAVAAAVDPNRGTKRAAIASAVLLLTVAALALIVVAMWPKTPTTVPEPSPIATPQHKPEPKIEVAPKPRDAGSMIADASVDSAADVGRGCGSPPPFKGEQEYLRDGADEWLTYIPKNYDPSRAHPLLLLLHQEQEPPAILLGATGFLELADEHNFIIIAPTDADGDLLTDVWHNDRPRDYEWLTRVFESTAEQLCVDRERIWVVGQGDSGKAVDSVICGGWGTAFATNSFRRGGVGTDCVEKPVPYLMLSPRHSQGAPFEGGSSLLCFSRDKASVADLEMWWRGQNRCKGKKRRARKDYKGSQCWTWDCEEQFVSCYLEGGHGWPGTPRRGPANNFADCDGQPADFPTTEYVWSFFESVDAARSDE